MSFFYKKLNKSEKEEIKKEANKIIDSFSKKLEEVKDLIKEDFVILENGMRKERNSFKGNLDFKKRILENAKEKNEDFIVAEKKRW